MFEWQFILWEWASRVITHTQTHTEICFCLHTHLYVVLSCSTSIFNFHLFSKQFFSDSPTSFLEGNSWSWIVRFIPIIILLGTSNFFFFGTQNIFKVLFFHTLKVNVVHTQLTFIVLTKKLKCRYWTTWGWQRLRKKSLERWLVKVKYGTRAT